jgi:hypothetical protein
VNELVVLDQQLHDLAGYLRCNIGNLHAELTVARPRCHHVMFPQANDREARECEQKKRECETDYPTGAIEHRRPFK